MNTINDECERFLDTVLPSGCSIIQRIEMQKAFYCGAETMRRLMCDLLGDENLSEEAGIALINGWSEEFQIFLQEKLKGKLNEQSRQV